MSNKKSIKFRFLCIITAFAGVFSCTILYYSWSNSNAQMENLLQDKAELALQFDLAIRSYVSETVRPFAQEHADKDEFIPEVMSTSFVARSVFDKVRKEHPEYTIKFSSDDPRNPRNLAGPEELKIIEYFNNNMDAKRWSGRIKIDGKEQIGLFSARRMKESCLQCHGDPKDAPASLIARYGDKAGFHRPIGQVIALDAIAMPLEKYQTAAVNKAIRTSIVMIAGLAILLITVYYTFHRLVGQRLTAIAKHFKNTASLDDKAGLKPLDCESNDEIGELAKTFNHMIDDLGRTMTSVDNLNKEVNDRKQAENRLMAEQVFTDTIIKSMPGLFYIFEKDSVLFVRRNENWAKVTGYSEDQLDTMTALDFFKEGADRDLCVEKMQKVFDSGWSSMENLLLTKTGKQIHTVSQGSSLILMAKPTL